MILCTPSGVQYATTGFVFVSFFVAMVMLLLMNSVIIRRALPIPYAWTAFLGPFNCSE